MRLINVETLRLEEFFDANIPRYAILSHTWGEDEVTFQDMQNSTAEHKLGYKKIQLSCQQAKVESIPYAWVDTCCIDKKSSAELSESINSMYRWYKKAEVCYVFLADVSASPSEEPSSPERYIYSNNAPWTDEFKASRWFTRGWTLQELIAPFIVCFYDRNWDFIGTRFDLCRIISARTKIDFQALSGTPPDSFCIAKRMSWASNRSTSRIEDRAYSLLGLFGVNMGLLYGEGTNAFRRLQEEIIRISTDQSIFAWDDLIEGTTREPKEVEFLASSPDNFHLGYKIVPYMPRSDPESYSITNRGLQISLPLLPAGIAHMKGGDIERFDAILSCRYEDNFDGPLALRIEATASKIKRKDTTMFGLYVGTYHHSRLRIVDSRAAAKAKPRSVCIVPNFHYSHIQLSSYVDVPFCLALTTDAALPAPLRVHDVFPAECWNFDMSIARLDVHTDNKFAAVLLRFEGQDSGIALSVTLRPTPGLCVDVHNPQGPVRHEVGFVAGKRGDRAGMGPPAQGSNEVYVLGMLPPWLSDAHLSMEWARKVTLTFARERVVLELLETGVPGERAFLVKIRQSLLAEER